MSDGAVEKLGFCSVLVEMVRLLNGNRAPAICIAVLLALIGLGGEWLSDGDLVAGVAIGLVATVLKALLQTVLLIELLGRHGVGARPIAGRFVVTVWLALIVNFAI